MTSDSRMVLELIGRVESSLIEVTKAPRQPDEGAPPATLSIDPQFREALIGISPGDILVVLTWLHLAPRNVHAVHPRGDNNRPSLGVFATRSSGRPNPIGIHTVTVTSLNNTSITVDSLEAIDGTPIIDIKPELSGIGDR